MKKGEKKAKAKLKAAVPVGDKKGRVTESFPTPEEARKLKSADILRLMKKAGRYVKADY